MRALMLGVSVLVISLFICGCTSNDELILSKSELGSKIQIDTIEKVPERGIYFVALISSKAFGKFSTEYAIIKKVIGDSQLVYKIENKRNVGVRITEKFISFVKSYGKTNWGWFNIKNGEIIEELPKINVILDSLKSVYPKDFFIRETNGYISFYNNGTLVKSISYGDFFVLNRRHVNFDSLKHKLYKLSGDTLITISKNVDDLFRQSEGVFFIPPPGYGIIKKYDKIKVFNVIDSLTALHSPIKRIRIPVYHENE